MERGGRLGEVQNGVSNGLRCHALVSEFGTSKLNRFGERIDYQFGQRRRRDRVAGEKSPVNRKEVCWVWLGEHIRLTAYSIQETIRLPCEVATRFANPLTRAAAKSAAYFQKLGTTSLHFLNRRSQLIHQLRPRHLLLSEKRAMGLTPLLPPRPCLLYTSPSPRDRQKS